MVSLIAKSPLDGMTGIEIDGRRLREETIDRIVSVAPFPGKEKQVSSALRKSAGVGFPEPNRILSKNDVRAVWTARDQAFVIGAEVSGLDGLAAVTQQSDGWVLLSLEGAGGEDVLARLVPLDLRASVFAVGQAARAPLGHMPAIIMRSGPDRLEVMVFRSMAKTAWHEIETAMRRLEARG